MTNQKVSVACINKLAKVFAKPQSSNDENYMTGSMLVDLFVDLGFVNDYYSFEKGGIIAEEFDKDIRPSRTQYVTQRLSYLNENGKLEKALLQTIQTSENPESFRKEIIDVLQPFGWILNNQGKIVSIQPLLNQAKPELMVETKISQIEQNKITVFISYSWDSPEHKQWVKQFADKLKENGVEVLLDEYQKYGQALTPFMMNGIKNADYVFVIGTPNYKQKAEAHKGGTNVEDQIINIHISKNFDTKKVIPILRKGSYEESFTTLIGDRKGFDFQNDDDFDVEFEKVLKMLFTD